MRRDLAYLVFLLAGISLVARSHYPMSAGGQEPQVANQCEPYHLRLALEPGCYSSYKYLCELDGNEGGSSYRAQFDFGRGLESGDGARSVVRRGSLSAGEMSAVLSQLEHYRAFRLTSLEDVVGPATLDLTVSRGETWNHFTVCSARPDMPQSQLARELCGSSLATGRIFQECLEEAKSIGYQTVIER